MSADPSEPALAEALLRAPQQVLAPERRRWVDRPVGAALVSLFVLYHVLVLLQHTTPSSGLAAPFSKALGERLKAAQYMRAASSVQSWSMFAPNPHRSNMFMQVLVELEDGRVLDLKHDMYGRREYPYLFYDRIGKINRRLIEQDRYQRHYAAWVCRDWALRHGGQSPVRVMFVKMWTRVPHPAKVIPFGGFDPMQLKLTKEPMPSVECATTVHAQLPDPLRARHGLPPLPPGKFREVIIQTWWDRAEASARTLERLRAILADEPPAQAAAGGEG